MKNQLENLKICYAKAPAILLYLTPPPQFSENILFIKKVSVYSVCINNRICTVSVVVGSPHTEIPTAVIWKNSGKYTELFPEFSISAYGFILTIVCHLSSSV